MPNQCAGKFEFQHDSAIDSPLNPTIDMFDRSTVQPFNNPSVSLNSPFNQTIFKRHRIAMDPSNPWRDWVPGFCGLAFFEAKGMGFCGRPLRGGKIP